MAATELHELLRDGSGAGLERAQAILLASTCQRIGRADLAWQLLRRAAEQSPDLAVDERNLLATTVKALIGAQRRACDDVVAQLREPETQANAWTSAVLSKLLGALEAELRASARSVLDVVVRQLQPAASGVEAAVLYHKLAGDCHRYLAEVSAGAERQEAVDGAMRAYRQAVSRSIASLHPAHPLRLSSALNLGLLHSDVLANTPAAARICKTAFDDAIGHVDELPDAALAQTSASVVSMLQDSIAVWTSTV
jgi:hypothetical protein